MIFLAQGCALLACCAVNRAREVERAFTGSFSLHGKLEDQHHAPIVDAEVVLKSSRITAFFGTFSSSGRHVTAKSDAQGLFSFSGVKGHLFYIHEIRKPGYVFMLRPYHWNYQNADTPKVEDISAPDHPCVIQGWKSHPPEEVAEIDLGQYGPAKPSPRVAVRSMEEFSRRSRFRIVVIGDPVVHPEETWQARVEVVSTIGDVAEWDLEMSLDATAQMPEPTDSRNNREAPLFPLWFPSGTAVRVRAKHGGVKQADWRYPYLAPEAGYQESVTLDWANSEPPQPTTRLFAVYYFDAHTSRYAYVRIRYEAGREMDRNAPLPQDWKQYACITLTDAYQEPAGVVNPHGSRVLEYVGAYNAQQVEQRMKPIRDKEQAESDARREAKLDWFRKNDPAEARLIEERMRSQGKVVPPPK